MRRYIVTITWSLCNNKVFFIIFCLVMFVQDQSRGKMKMENIVHHQKRVLLPSKNILALATANIWTISSVSLEDAWDIVYRNQTFYPSQLLNDTNKICGYLRKCLQCLSLFLTWVPRWLKNIFVIWQRCFLFTHYTSTY